jgi:hypothetical protein
MPVAIMSPAPMKAIARATVRPILPAFREKPASLWGSLSTATPANTARNMETSQRKREGTRISLKG